jgi:hypothetical protein
MKKKVEDGLTVLNSLISISQVTTNMNISGMIKQLFSEIASKEKDFPQGKRVPIVLFHIIYLSIIRGGNV